MSAVPPGSSQPLTPRHKPYPPLKPQRKLLRYLCIAFGIWVAFLMAMYFTTVFPRTHHYGGSSGGPATNPATQAAK